MDHTKRAEELARNFKTMAGSPDEGTLTERAANVYADSVAKVAYKEAMLRCLPIIERLRKPEHDAGCAVMNRGMDPCSCTLGTARQQADELLGTNTGKK